MTEGKVWAAILIITETNKGGVLPLTKEVQKAVIKKSTQTTSVPSAIIEPDTSVKKPHFITFEQFDGHMIRKTALKTDGLANNLYCLSGQMVLLSLRG